MARKKLPEDYGINAMVAEVERRRKLPGGHGYDYGRLIAETTPAQREQIKEEYRNAFLHSLGVRKTKE